MGKEDSRGSRSWAMETVPVLLWVGVGQRDSQPRSHHAWGQSGHVLQEQRQHLFAFNFKIVSI